MMKCIASCDSSRVTRRTSCDIIMVGGGKGDYRSTRLSHVTLYLSNETIYGALNVHWKRKGKEGRGGKRGERRGEREEKEREGRGGERGKRRREREEEGREWKEREEEGRRGKRREGEGRGGWTGGKEEEKGGERDISRKGGGRRRREREMMEGKGEGRGGEGTTREAITLEGRRRVAIWYRRDHPHSWGWGSLGEG